MSRTRRIITSCLRGRRGLSDEGGFSLIEVLVALSLLVTVMATTAGFFTTSLKQSNGQTQAQEAAALAEQQLDYTRSVAATSLLSGRCQTDVAAAVASPGIANLSQDILPGTLANPNFDKTVSAPNTVDCTKTQAVPISTPQTVGGTAYTVTTFINECFVAVAANQTCTATDSGNGWIYRITVDVSYKLSGGRSCGASSCQYVVSTLRDPGTDACFNVNPNYAGCSVSQPTITLVNPSTVTTGSTTTVTLTGTNFDPGATVSLLSGGTAGTVSNVNVISPTSLSFTLVTGNTAAAVGSQTLKVLNPNGKFAQGTFTITTTAINVVSVAPSPVSTSATVTMTISGSGFQSGSVVSIPATAGTILGTPTIAPTSITLSFMAGSGAAAVGTWAATVTNPDGNSDTGNFVVQKAPITVTAISPATMAWGSTRSFTLTGTGFNSAAQVTLDGSGVTETWVSSTSMTVSLTTDPSVATHTFAVTNPDGGTASKTFVVTVNPMSVTSVTPKVTLLNSTKAFTISGSGFLSAATVKLDGTVVATSSTTATAISLTLSAFPALGGHTFTVTNPDGGTATGTFTVAKAHITSMSPTTIAHGTQVTVTITGTNFVTSGATTPAVTVNGSATGVTTVSIASTTSVTFKYTITSTKGTYTYPVQVTSKDGSVSDVFSWVVTSS
jgi:Tfp pilus assembly protein PilV